MTASDRSKAKSQISCALLLSVSLALCLLAHKRQTRLQQPIGQSLTAAEQDWPFEFNLSTLHMSYSATAIQTASSHKQCSAQVWTQLHCGGAQADSQSYLRTQTGLPRTTVLQGQQCKIHGHKQASTPDTQCQTSTTASNGIPLTPPEHYTTLNSKPLHAHHSPGAFGLASAYGQTERKLQAVSHI